MKIEIKINQEITPSELTILLRDALHDFVRVRTPVDEYLQKRYSAEYLADFPNKKQQIENRVALAKEIQDKIIFLE
jgi:hypothetical protein